MTTRLADLPMRLQALFDERRDPLDEASVQAWLLEHPDQLEAFARFRAGLPLAVAERVPVAASRYLRWLPLAACVLAAAVLAVRHCAVVAGPAPLPRPDFASGGRILSFSSCTAVAGSSAHDGLASSWSAMTHGGTAAVHRVATFTSRAAPSPSVPLCVMVIRAEENQPSCPRP